LKKPGARQHFSGQELFSHPVDTLRLFTICVFGHSFEIGLIGKGDIGEFNWHDQTPAECLLQILWFIALAGESKADRQLNQFKQNLQND